MILIKSKQKDMNPIKPIFETGGCKNDILCPEFLNRVFISTIYSYYYACVFRWYI